MLDRILYAGLIGAALTLGPGLAVAQQDDSAGMDEIAASLDAEDGDMTDARQEIYNYEQRMDAQDDRIDDHEKRLHELELRLREQTDE